MPDCHRQERWPPIDRLPGTLEIKLVLADVAETLCFVPLELNQSS